MIAYLILKKYIVILECKNIYKTTRDGKCQSLDFVLLLWQSICPTETRRCLSDHMKIVFVDITVRYHD